MEHLRDRQRAEMGCAWPGGLCECASRPCGWPAAGWQGGWMAGWLVGWLAPLAVARPRPGQGSSTRGGRVIGGFLRPQRGPAHGGNQGNQGNPLHSAAPQHQRLSEHRPGPWLLLQPPEQRRSCGGHSYTSHQIHALATLGAASS